MPRERFRHGCLLFAVGALSTVAARSDEPVQVQSRVVDIEYAVNNSALPLNSVQLWYTLDDGFTWRGAGFDDDRQSPITFHAPQEGLYGFFVVVANSTGPSSTPPTQGLKPHLRAFIDDTPPIVQLHPVHQTTTLGQRVLQIRWSAIDSYLGSRPVTIAYQRPPDQTWYPVTPDPMANTGRFDWRLPESLTGPVAIRLTVRDGGGNQVNSERRVVEVAPAPAPAETQRVDTRPVAPTRDAVYAAFSAGRSETTATRTRAPSLFDEAMELRDRGEYREGIMRLREAVKLNPRWPDAFAQMGDMLYRIGDLDRSLNAYELALREQPSMRTALRGAAMIHQQKKDHPSAARYLRRILRYDANDAEVWMNLGDIAIYQGDEVLARECYTRATRTDLSATQIIDDARKRLALMAEVSRRYQQDGR